MEERPPTGPSWSTPAPNPSAERSGSVEHWLLPTGRSGWAIAAGYLGLLSMLLVFAPLSLAVGLWALRDLHNKPGLGGRGRGWFGVIAGAAGTVGLLLWIL